MTYERNNTQFAIINIIGSLLHRRTTSRTSKNVISSNKKKRKEKKRNTNGVTDLTLEAAVEALFALLISSSESPILKEHK